MTSGLTKLTSFQQALLEDMTPCRWYSVYEVDDLPRLPDWFFRQQTQPFATLRPMCEQGALILKQFPIGLGMTVPAYKRRCCERMGEYNGYGSGPLIFECPNNCPCHD